MNNPVAMSSAVTISIFVMLFGMDRHCTDWILQICEVGLNRETRG